MEDDLPLSAWTVLGRHYGLMRPDEVRRELERIVRGEAREGDREAAAEMEQASGLTLVSAARMALPWFGGGR